MIEILLIMVCTCMYNLRLIIDFPLNLFVSLQCSHKLNPLIMKKNKSPFDPIKFRGSKALWFSNYLDKKERDQETEKNRKATLRRAAKLNRDSNTYAGS